MPSRISSAFRHHFIASPSPVCSANCAIFQHETDTSRAAWADSGLPCGPKARPQASPGHRPGSRASKEQSPNGAAQIPAPSMVQSHTYRSSISIPCFRHNARNSS
jgi:hypothetical protein